MKKTVLWMLLVNITMLQAANDWIWEEEQNTKAELEAIKIETERLRELLSEIQQGINQTPPNQVIGDTPQSSITPNKYTLNINTVPKNAQYTLKDSKNRKINYSWGMKLPKGKYSLKVFKNGYKSGSKSFTLNKNKSIKIKLTKICKLRINPNVSNATIKFTNGRNYSRGMILTCNQSYFLNVSKPGYKTQRISTFMRNSKTNISVKLKRNSPKMCKLTILPNKTGARVYITNIMAKYKKGIALPCGRKYNIKVTKRGCPTRRFTTTLTHNEKIPVNLCR